MFSLNGFPSCTVYCFEVILSSSTILLIQPRDQNQQCSFLNQQGRSWAEKNKDDEQPEAACGGCDGLVRSVRVTPPPVGEGGGIYRDSVVDLSPALHPEQRSPWLRWELSRLGKWCYCRHVNIKKYGRPAGRIEWVKYDVKVSESRIDSQKSAIKRKKCSSNIKNSQILQGFK